MKRPPASAHNTVMNLLARREHSEKELKRKLKQREFSEEEINKAIERAKEGRWLASPEETAGRFANQLSRKNKGIHYINSTLAKKGLPAITRDESLELEKARALVKTKYRGFSEFTREQKAKVARFLASRGFDMGTIRKVLKDDEEY